ncbi:MAG: mandelate racemase/muconate lactonizing enzyme family protein [Solirubrobacterales bacterium]
MIRRVEVVPYGLPFRQPYVTARGRLERRELILLRLTDGEGVVGLGETTSLSLRGGRALAAIAAELEGLAAIVDAEPGGVSTFQLSRELGSNEASCAFAIAVMDLGLKTGELEPAQADPVPCNATLSAGAPAAVAESALRWQELGFASFKLKVGPSEGVAQVTAVREALGPEPAIRVDANGTWSEDEAITALSELAPHRLELCEQPVASLEQMATVIATTEVPIAADESVTNPEQARRAVELGACDLATLKLAKVGGPAAAERGDWGLPVYISSALEGPVGIAAAGRVAAALRGRRDGADAGVAHGLATQLLFSETIASVGPEVRDGMLHLPEGPGLGVRIDEDALNRLRI